jgi:glyoxylase-like metal-dependent hydrolase (beta-lactamase superfamily II)
MSLIGSPQQHRLNQVSQHVYWLSPDSTTDRPVLGAIAGEEATLLVDAGNSPAHARLFLEELGKLAIPSPRYLVITHWHWDHVFGAHTLNLPTFASLETRRIVTHMARLDWSDAALDKRVEEGSEIAFCRDNIKAELPERKDLALKAPDVAFSARVELDLGGVTCQLVHVGGDHASDSSVIYAVEDRVLFYGDCLGEDYYSGEPSYTTRKLFPLIDLLLSFDAEFYLEGHAPEPQSRQRFVEDVELLRVIGRVVDRIGTDRKAVLETLETRFGAPLSEDVIDIVNAFLAGLRKSGAVQKIAG